MLRVYSLGPTNTLYIDAGNYPLLLPMTLSGISGIGDDRAFTIVGPTDTELAATISFANPLMTAPLLTLDDADFMNISHLTFQGGQYGIFAETNSTNLTASYLKFVSNSVDGILIQNSPNVTLENSSASRNGQDGVHIISGSNVLDLGNITAFANGNVGIAIDGAIAGLHNSSATYNTSDGIHMTNVGGVTLTDDNSSNNGGFGIYLYQQGTTQAVIGNTNLALNLGNVVAGNSAGGIETWNNVLVAGNTISGSTAAGAFGIYLDYAGEAADNDIFNNNSGILTFDTDSPIHGNRVYGNKVVGISSTLNSPVYDNVVYSNGIGIFSTGVYNGGPETITNNLVYANTTQGILVQNAAAGAQVVNNTVYEPSGDGIRIEDTSKNVVLRNNTVWVQTGYDISVASDSQVGFASDYNDLYTSAAGQVGLWQQIPRADLQAWRTADFTDQSSLALNPQFVNVTGADGVLGYQSALADGRDDDFHEQSQQGSYHGGSLAPVVSSTTTLPVFPTPTVTIDANESSAIDRGAASDSFSNEPTPNGGYINIGAVRQHAASVAQPAAVLACHAAWRGRRGLAGRADVQYQLALCLGSRERCCSAGRHGRYHALAAGQSHARAHDRVGCRQFRFLCVDAAHIADAGHELRG